MSCYGCSENLANQLAHMDFGGCLYEPECSVEIETPCSEAEVEPVGCIVCMTLGRGFVRRASPGMLRCQSHQAQCTYCRSECDETSLFCERCSYSGAASVAMEDTQEILCLYDRDMNPSESLMCGCPFCMEASVEAESGEPLSGTES
jgi:hypothetical protein